MNIYEAFKNWTAKRERTDIWRAVIGILIIFFLLLWLTGCTTQGPRMTLAASYEGDGFIRVTQPVFEKGSVNCFVEYEHHSEIFRETLEDTGDFGLVGCTKQFKQWRFLQ